MKTISLYKLLYMDRKHLISESKSARLTKSVRGSDVTGPLKDMPVSSFKKIVFY